MKRSRGGKQDSRDIIIGILTIVVLIESYLLLFNNRPGKFKAEEFVKKIGASRTVDKSTPPVLPIVPKAAPAREPIKTEPVPAPVPKQVAGRIAIILDDWGYNSTSCEPLAAIKSPVTVAVLPNLPHSVDVANCAHEQNKEVMLHLPLEPHQNLDRYPEDYIIKTSMNKTKVEELLAESLKNIPHLAGVNNHMGSKATENRRLMSIIFTRLKEKKLFFVDSYVTGDSICKSVAKEIKIPFTRRDVFLDNKNERAYIENQFVELAKTARKNGSAVAIGHDRALTLQIVKEQTALLEAQGFRIVTVRHLLGLD